MKKASIYLIPNLLGDEANINASIPSHNIEIISSLRHFVVEHIKDARRFLVKIGLKDLINQSEFFELNNQSDPRAAYDIIQVAAEGNDMGIISDAGCPGIADPGAGVVHLAHQKGMRVVPLIGPSSILLAVMASGFNGQSFAFNGYIDRDKSRRASVIRFLEEKASKENQTQVLMETPYRNEALFDDLINTLNPNTLLSIACDISLPTEYIKTRKVMDWKKEPKQNLQKRPAIFSISA
ncbi:MAG: SAM-dependent methyltransferase [Bacteroidetes bacterium]|nr:MAG: SAM-dependent methyltransferase [Bacteroidota bacterium]MBL1144290.1 SAM-dependent methyltransferase [Bacteroidota bacterium]MCB0802682.1 SAM-dependent methyltransferase [Flavobacteriales bacterium]NOG57087.1 SAM-dependent methyltransferase [Bacteroidota bacterium]